MNGIRRILIRGKSDGLKIFNETYDNIKIPMYLKDKTLYLFNGAYNRHYTYLPRVEKAYISLLLIVRDL